MLEGQRTKPPPMLRYLFQRSLYTIFLLALLTVVIFIVIQLPPGDYLSTLISRLEQSGETVSEEMIENLKRQYGLDLSLHQRYFKWVTAVLKGNFGFSFDYNEPVRDIIGERLILTIIISLLSAAFVYSVAIPIGIYSATHQYSVTDYLVSFVGYVGLAIPNFMLALILMYVALAHFQTNLTGLFSPEYLDAPWDIHKVLDMIKHLPIPIIVVGTGGTAGMIRVMRGTLLDELNKQYVITARSKGVGEIRLLFKYPVRPGHQPTGHRLCLALPVLDFRRRHRSHGPAAAHRRPDDDPRPAHAGYFPGRHPLDVPERAYRRWHFHLRYPARLGGSAHPHGARRRLGAEGETQDARTVAPAPPRRRHPAGDIRRQLLRRLAMAVDVAQIPPS